MVATLVGVTLVAGLTSVPLVSGSGADVTLSAADAAAVRSLERVGEVPAIPTTVVVPEPAVRTPSATIPVPPAAVNAGEPTTTTTTTTAVAVTPPPEPPPAVPTTVPPTTAPLSLPAIGLAPLLPGASASGAGSAPSRSQVRVASWFGAPAGTCAHRTLPFGTEIRVTGLQNGAVATCTVDDRGPTLATGRLIDLSPDTFERLESTDAGLIEVTIEW